MGGGEGEVGVGEGEGARRHVWRKTVAVFCPEQPVGGAKHG